MNTVDEENKNLEVKLTPKFHSGIFQSCFDIVSQVIFAAGPSLNFNP